MVVLTEPSTGPPPVRFWVTPFPIVSALRLLSAPTSTWKFPPVAPQESSSGLEVVVPPPPVLKVAAVKLVSVTYDHVSMGLADATLGNAAMTATVNAANDEVLLKERRYLMVVLRLSWI